MSKKKKMLIKKSASVVLSAVIAAGTVFSAYAVDPVSDIAEATTETETAGMQENEPFDQNASESEEIGETVSEEIESELAESVPYIFLLPVLDGVEYVYDEAHYDTEFSTEEYKVLLYGAGENVGLTVNTDMEYAVLDAGTQEMFLDGANGGHLTFSMPEKDLTLAFVQEDIPAESETPTETEALGTESATEEDLEPTTEESEPISETGTGAEDTSEVVMENSVNEIPEEESEDKYTDLPEAGSTVVVEGIEIPYDCWTFDPLDDFTGITDVYPEDEFMIHFYYADDIDWVKPGAYKTSYYVSPVWDEDYIFFVERPVIVMEQEEGIEWFNGIMSLAFEDGPLAAMSMMRANIKAHVERTGWINYTDVGLGTSAGTGIYTVTISGKKYSCYCIEPSLGNIPTATATAKSVSNSSDLAKVAYYCAVGSNSDPTGNYWADSGNSGFSMKKKKLLLHLALSKANGMPSWSTNVNAAGKKLVNEMVNYAKAQPAIPGGDFAFTTKKGDMSTDINNEENSGVKFVMKNGSYVANVLYFTTDDDAGSTKLKVPSYMKATVTASDGKKAEYAAGKTFTLHKDDSFVLSFAASDLGSVNAMVDKDTNELEITTTPAISGYTCYTIKPKSDQQKGAFCYPTAEGEPTSIYFKVDIVPTVIEIQKISATTGQPVPPSDKYSFNGAVYTVYEDAACTKVLTTITTNASGYGKSSELAVDQGTTLYVKETVAPPNGNYELDKTVYKVEAGQKTKITSPEQEKLGRLIINKSLDAMEGMSEEELQELYDKGTLAGITFNVEFVNDPFYDTKPLVTDKYGVATVENRLLGTYILTEQPNTTPEFYIPSGPIKVEVTGVDKPAEYNVVNRRPKWDITISKKDLDSGKLIARAGAEFRILDQDKNPIKLKLKGSNVPNDIFTTDGTGTVHFDDEISAGIYYLEEVKAPEGYKLASERIRFVVNTTEDGGGVEIAMHDEAIKYSFQVVKVDALTGENCGEGFTFEVTAAEDILDGDGSVRIKAGTLVDTIHTNAEGIAKTKELFPGKYQVKETKAADGYSFNGKTYEVVLNEETSGNELVTVKVENQPTVLILKKIDTLTEKPMAGVTFRIKEIGTEDSDEQLHVTDKDGSIRVEYLSAGKTYTIQETATLPGYNLDESIYEFTVDEKGFINGLSEHTVTFTNQPNVVHISKVDITDGKELPGASMKLTDKDGKVIDEWISTEEPHIIYSLPDGKYILTETAAPEGYEIAEAIEFELENSMVVQEIVMKDSPYREVVISKKAITGTEELPGCTLTIKDANNQVVDTWVTGEEPHKLKLPSGKYSLTEEIAADGYVTSEPIIFEVKQATADDFGIIQVEMKDDVTKVQISKKDITTGEELPGAKLAILNEKGETVEEWISTEEPHYIEKLPVGKYTLTELQSPEGYGTAASVKFTVKDTGVIQMVEMSDIPYREVEISKKDITTDEELPGAHLEIRDEEDNLIDEWVSEETPHVLQLPAGKYVLIETIPADGFVTADSITFEVLARDQKGDMDVQRVEMFDDVTKVEISKQDVTNEKELPGAYLELRDEEDNLIEEWVSTDEPHYIEKLPAGKYVLIETAAPKGYEVSEKVEFTILDTAEIQRVVMYDAPIPETPVTPQTGDMFSIPQFIAFISVILILITYGIIAVKNNRKDKKEE